MNAGSSLLRRHIVLNQSRRQLSTITQSSTQSSIPPLQTPHASQSSSLEAAEPNTHYKITLTRSAIGLPKRVKATLEALGIWRRMGTAFMPHTPEAAGKILRLKEIVSVRNVPASQVRNKIEMRQERKAPRGYVVVDRLGGSSS
ncbi:hypothetical protein FRB95_001043 [Tulasnella sp. JGI-2019a]|nr:hypothetical protein FRB95_001043 [Tulasnella sp. JGI-2019a]